MHEVYNYKHPIVDQNLILSHLHRKLLKAVVTCFSIAALSLILNQLWGSRCESSVRSMTREYS